MTCAEAEPLIGASIDGELDAATALQIDKHLSACDPCSVVFRKLERLRDDIATADLDWSATADLRPLAARIRRSNRRGWWQTPWLWRSMVGAVAAAVLILIALPRNSGTSAERQLVDNHLRSLLADHLIDVPSSNQHTVKPWFQGKLNFAPSVPDLSSEGFALIGGRLDVIGGRQAAAIVYKRREHVVNLWIQPAGGADRGIDSTTVEGFHLLRWRKDGMLYWAISDLNPQELREFAELIRAH